MDGIYKLGLTNLFIEIGFLVIKKFKVDTKFAHLDSTFFHQTFIAQKYSGIIKTQIERGLVISQRATIFCR